MQYKRERDYLVGFHISDIHFGAMDSEMLYNELEKEFLNRLCYGIDIIAIAGDTFHKILSANSNHFKYFNKFWVNLLNKCTIYNIKYIRVIQGTSSHDNNQLNILKAYENFNNIDIRVIETVSSEIIDNIKVLYLPEEYMENKDVFYADYFNGEYDLCIGHGLFKETCFVEQENEIPMSHAPVYDINILGNIVKGPILFGHIHNRTIINNKVYYSGSFSALNHADDDKKGYHFFCIRKSDIAYNVTFIENKSSRKFQTIHLNLEDEVEEIINEIEGFKIYNEIDNLRVKFTITSSEERYKYLIINKNFVTDNDIKIENVSNIKIKNKKDKEKIDKIVDKYEGIFEYDDEAYQIAKFHEIKTGEKVSPDIIKKYLYD